MLTPNDTPYDLNEHIQDTPEWLVEALRVPREEGTIRAADCDIHYFRWGTPDKPPVIMAHGFLAHARAFAFIAPLLARHFHLVAFDWSGMGDSGTRESYPASVRTREIIELIDAAGLTEHAIRPTIVAHSYGGSAGLSAMEQAHEKFNGLVICDLMAMRPERLKEFNVEFTPPGANEKRRENKVYTDYATARNRFILSPAQETPIPALGDYMAFHSLREVDGGWSWKFDPGIFVRDKEHENNWRRQSQRIAEAPGRKAVIFGEDSLLFDEDSAEFVRELGGTDIPMVAIPKAKHHLMLDQPIAFASALKTVLTLWTV